jgi:hypothetical protein
MCPETRRADPKGVSGNRQWATQRHVQRSGRRDTKLRCVSKKSTYCQREPKVCLDTQQRGSQRSLRISAMGLGTQCSGTIPGEGIKRFVRTSRRFPRSVSGYRQRRTQKCIRIPAERNPKGLSGYRKRGTQKCIRIPAVGNPKVYPDTGRGEPKVYPDTGRREPPKCIRIPAEGNPNVYLDTGRGEPLKCIRIPAEGNPKVYPDTGKGRHLSVSSAAVTAV